MERFELFAASGMFDFDPSAELVFAASAAKINAATRRKSTPLRGKEIGDR